MRHAGLEEVQAGIKISRRNINNLRYADDTTLMAESEEELKRLLMKMKEESEKEESETAKVCCLVLGVDEVLVTVRERWLLMQELQIKVVVHNNF